MLNVYTNFDFFTRLSFSSEKLLWEKQTDR